MNCPTCPSLLVQLQVGPIELDECPRCLGMWFDDGELKTFVGARLEAKTLPQRFVPPAAGALSGSSACPRCVTTRLKETTQFGHTMSGCGRCGGVWATAPLVSALLASASTAEAPETPKPEAVTPATAAPAAAPAAAEPPKRQTAPARKTVELQGGCTACGADMEPVVHEGHAFHRCTGCGALFFTRGGLPQFLRRGISTWEPPPAGGPEPGEERRCPACQYAMEPVSLSGHPVRMWACTDCWSMFASASGVRKLIDPNEREEALSGPALGLWRMLDAFTEWLVELPITMRRTGMPYRRF